MSAVAAERIVSAFERAPVLAERVAARVEPSDDAERIVAIAREELARMNEHERMAVLDAHPRIGADRATLSMLSRREQGDDADASTVSELELLNRRYEERFGFRFVIFVDGRPKVAIADVLRSRLARPRDEELRTGIDQFLAIARDRLRRGP